MFIDEIVAAYLTEYAAYSPSREFLTHTARPILEWWSGKQLTDVTGRNCRRYVAWRTGQKHRRAKARKKIGVQTARHDLKTLRTAINWYHREHGPLAIVPTVSLPYRQFQRPDYWLTRDEVAARIRAARNSKATHHVARQLLIGVYTGTRPGAILKLNWLPSASVGWVDLQNGILHRRASNARRTRKRAPPARIHARLLPHLRRWPAMDLARGITSVIHYQGAPVKKLRNSWASVARRATGEVKDGPDITRHTAATLANAGGHEFV